MIRKRLGRIATALTTAALLGVMVAAPVSAAPPGWKFIDQVQLPATVAPNALAGYSFTIFNDGKSNIAALYLGDTSDATVEFVWNSRGTVCQMVPTLRCSFGALAAKGTIEVIVAYRVGTANLNNQFRLDSTGDPAGGNNSHGDSEFSNFPVTVVESDVDFDGGFVKPGGDFVYETTGTLGRSNKQISKAQVSETVIPVTIEDGITSYPCSNTDPQCTNFIGEWTELDVNGGDNTQLIKVTLMIWGGSVPGGVDASEISLIHADGSGSADPVTALCNASLPTNADCIESVTKVGNNFRIVAWLTQNGGLRGTY